MMAADGLALEARRLRGALTERADAVLSLEQRRSRLAAALQLRLRDIRARAQHCMPASVGRQKTFGSLGRVLVTFPSSGPCLCHRIFYRLWQVC